MTTTDTQPDAPGLTLEALGEWLLDEASITYQSRSEEQDRESRNVLLGRWLAYKFVQDIIESGRLPE